MQSFQHVLGASGSKLGERLEGRAITCALGRAISVNPGCSDGLAAMRLTASRSICYRAELERRSETILYSHKACTTIQVHDGQPFSVEGGRYIVYLAPKPDAVGSNLSIVIDSFLHREHHVR